MDTLPQTLIIGYGEMGHAIESLLQDRSRIEIWPVTPQQLEPPVNVQQVLPSSQFICMCVPTIAHPELIDRISPLLADDSITLSVAKGVDAACRNTAEILADGIGPEHAWGVLCGPMISHEILAGKPAYAQAGIHEPAIFTRVQTLFAGSNLHLSHFPHPEAACWCSVLKNVYAPLFGIIEELGFGDNARGQLLAGVIREMDGLVEGITGIRHAVYAEAGLADLMTTVTSPTSHHRTLGQRVARGEIHELHGEGLHTLEIMLAQQRVATAAFTLYQIAGGLVTDPAHVPAALGTWLGRPIKT